MKATAKITDRSSPDIAARVDAIDWTQATTDLDAQGCAVLKGLLSPDECRAIAALYPDDKNFRSRIVMGRHGFGRGEYKYFSYPLPDLIAELRPALYARLYGDRQSLERDDGDRHPLSAGARSVPEALPRCRADPADAAAAAI